MKDVHKLRELPGLPRTELEQIQEGILALAQIEETKRYTWEQKIDNLARVAKEVGVYLDAEIEAPGSDYTCDTRRRLMAAYEEFCQWRHEEPCVIDEIKALIAQEER